MLFYSTEQALQDCFMLASGSVNFFVDETEEKCRPLQISSSRIGSDPDPYKSDLLHHARLPTEEDYARISQLAVIEEMGISPEFAQHFLSILQNGSCSWMPYAIQALPDLVVIYYLQQAAGSGIAAIIIDSFRGQMEVEVPVSDNSADTATTKFSFGCVADMDLGSCMYIHHDQQLYRLRYQDLDHPDSRHCLLKTRHILPIL